MYRWAIDSRFPLAKVSHERRRIINSVAEGSIGLEEEGIPGTKPSRII
jgi:hypothetical protein